jgi:hypothetical protein
MGCTLTEMLAEYGNVAFLNSTDQLGDPVSMNLLFGVISQTSSIIK